MNTKISVWIKKELKASGTKGIVLGLSGGVDSSVVAALSKAAAGRHRVLGLFMPIHSDASDLKDATLVAKKLGIKTRLIDLSGIYDNLLNLLPEAGARARANLKPRLRMVVLYYFANKLNYLVSGTGNKSELMAGYFTKHGDGATDILPIGGLFKKQVWKLAEELNIPRRIIDKAPSAGLWRGQTDEGEMGITYAELDNILERLEKKEKVTGKNAGKVKEMIKRSGHKRQGPKICHI